MQILLTSAAFLASAICAGLMGYAIQRGATCTVAAMDEVVRKRSASRLLAMGEAALWVAGGLLLAQSLHVLGRMPGGYAVTYATITGGALLGLGAFVNRACVFGAIARLGSGEWSYLATPVGFYVGCVTSTQLFQFPAQQKLPYDSPVLQTSSWIALPIAAAMLWRVARPLCRWATARGGSAATRQERVGHGPASRVWSPHAATTVIGITFVVMLLLVGAWAYTDVLAELARRMSDNLVARGLLALALLAGAMLGGYTGDRWRSTPVSFPQLAKCFVGGLMMGWGSLLIPGSNDGLVLVGMPLLWPYAWVAFLTMCVSIATALIVERQLMGDVAEHAVH